VAGRQERNSWLLPPFGNCSPSMRSHCPVPENIPDAKMPVSAAAIIGDFFLDVAITSYGRRNSLMIKAATLLAAALVLASPAARAQTWPSRSITLIIPFAAGGSNDVVGRAIGKKLTEAWGQPVVIENRPGAGALIGTEAVAKAQPDGYTLLLVSPTFTIGPAVRKNMPYDTVRDFTPVAFIGRSPLLVAASSKVPAQSAKELFALARSEPGRITYASAGV